MKDKIKPGFYKEQILSLEKFDYFSWSKCASILESPLAFYRKYKEGKVSEPSKAMDFGNMLHMAALEPAKFRDRFVLMPEFTGLTKDGKPSTRSADALEKKEKWMKSQRKDAVICTKEEMEKLIVMIENIMHHEKARDLLTGGRSEGWLYSWDEEFGRWNLSRPDFITEDLITVEVKTTSKLSLNARIWAREAFNRGYHGQLAHNTRGVSLAHGMKDNHRAAWIVVQSVEPYEVFVFTADLSTMLAGEMKAIKAYERINKFLGLDPLMENRKIWHGKQRGLAENCVFDEWMCKEDPDLDTETQTE